MKFNFDSLCFFPYVGKKGGVHIYTYLRKQHMFKVREKKWRWGEGLRRMEALIKRKKENVGRFYMEWKRRDDIDS